MSVSESPNIPGPDVFQAAFGCDSSIDLDLVQTNQFIDQKGMQAVLTFGALDNSFGLVIEYSGFEIVRVYDEHLCHVSILEDEQMIEVRLGPERGNRVISVRIWPDIQVQQTYLSC